MISAIVLTKNEEKNIQECLEGLKWCDEIIVIDDNSSDKTRVMAQKFGARVLEHSLNHNFSQQRNFGLKEARHDWISFVDADERVSPKLAEEIKKKISQTTVSGFYFKRIDFFMGKWLRHGEIGKIRILRLGRRGSGQWKRSVDEKWQVEGETETLKNPLFHYPHQTLSEFLTSINERSDLNAECFYQEGRKAGFIDWLKPLGKFVWNYFFLFGFLDKSAGFVFGVLMSLHSFLVRGKLYLLWRRRGG